MNTISARAASSRRKSRMLHHLLRSTAVLAFFLAFGPTVQAAQINWDFEVTIDSGALIGQIFGGTLQYDDASVTGVGDLNIDRAGGADRHGVPASPTSLSRGSFHLDLWHTETLLDRGAAWIAGSETSYTAERCNRACLS